MQISYRKTDLVLMVLFHDDGIMNVDRFLYFIYLHFDKLSAITDNIFVEKNNKNERKHFTKITNRMKTKINKIKEKRLKSTI